MPYTFQKFNSTVEAVGRKVHNLNADSLKIMLTNVAPVAGNSIKTDITDIAAGNGYAAGGSVIASSSYTQTSGVGKLIGNAVTFTASGGDMAAFRYAVIYNDSATNKELLGWYDYGVSVTLHDGEIFKAAKDTSGNNWDSTIPILTFQ